MSLKNRASYKDGYAAFAAGESIKTNPHYNRDVAYSDWRQGWFAGQQAASEDRAAKNKLED